jgi:hypothetical protein
MKNTVTIVTNHKSRWVKQAQREGKKLVPWIVETLNSNSKKLESKK